jgi:hypothetical protein
VNAFLACEQLEILAFPASLVVIDDCAFEDCDELRIVTFAPKSQLQRIGDWAFTSCNLESVLLPATLRKIGPHAFHPDTWPEVRFGGFVDCDEFICEADSNTLFIDLSYSDQVVIPAYIEVIGADAFARSHPFDVVFESGSRLREIAKSAFLGCRSLKKFNVPSSVLSLNERCFEMCSRLARITFEEISELRRIGESAFTRCGLTSITIPASTEEIDGSAFLRCPLIEIRVAPGSPNFIVQGNLLVTSDGREIVRCFGFIPDVVVPMNVEVFGKSCFESCSHIESVVFERGSKLSRIGRSALSGCESLMSIAIPDSVEVIDQAAFKGCLGLEECLFADNSFLQMMENEAFSGCRSLRSFCVPRSVRAIGQNSFDKCASLHRLRFGSGESLMRIIGDVTLDEGLEYLGFNKISTVFKIEVAQGRVELNFPGWVSVDEAAAHLTLAQDIW